MVGRILRLFHKETAGIHQAAFLMGILTLVSQILALFRDRMLAHYFGAGQTLDLYYTAFRIPDFLFASLASLVSISVLIPFMSGVLEHRRDEAKDLLSSVFTVFFATMVVVSIFVAILMPYIAPWVFPGIKDPVAMKQLISLARLLLIQPICLGISNVFGVVTQIGKRFILYSLSPIFYNVSIIFGIVFLYPHFGIRGVIAGVVLGGVLHFSIQMPYVFKEGLLPKLTTHLDWVTIKQVIRISIPRTIALSANTLELIFITAYASVLTVGSISIFNLSMNLQSVPFAIIGVSYALAAFPTLSAHFAKGERRQFMEHMLTATKHVIFWSIPVAALFIVLRAQIVRTILGSGNFNWDDTKLAAACLALFTVSLVGQGLELLFIRGYYAAGMTKKPLGINLLSSFITIFSPWVLLIVFKHDLGFRFFIESLFKVEGIPGTEVLMLPLGYSIGTIVNAIIFWFLFEKDFGNIRTSESDDIATMVPGDHSKIGEMVHGYSFTARALPTLSVSIQAAVFGGFTAYLGLNLFAKAFNLNTVQGVFFQGLCGGIMGIAGCIFIFLILGNKEIIEVWAALRQRISRNKIIVSEPDRIET